MLIYEIIDAIYFLILTSLLWVRITRRLMTPHSIKSRPLCIDWGVSKGPILALKESQEVY